MHMHVHPSSCIAHIRTDAEDPFSSGQVELLCEVRMVNQGTCVFLGVGCTLIAAYFYAHGEQCIGITSLPCAKLCENGIFTVSYN